MIAISPSSAFAGGVVRDSAGRTHVQAARATGLRLTRRGRAVVTVGALLLASGALLSAQTAQAEAPASAVAVTTHTVTAGDTLWSVASTVAAPGEDLRDVVAEMRRLNGMSDSSLRVGQMLLVPQE